MDTRFPVTWTVKLVQETLIEAAWHCKIAVRADMPGYRAMPEFFLTGDERIAEGWDRALEADEDEKARRIRRRRISPARVSFLERAVIWPMTYLHDERDYARALQLWLGCKVSKRKFGEEVEQRGWSRATAYRDRDRALTIISVGLDRDGIPLWGE